MIIAMLRDPCGSMGLLLVLFKNDGNTFKKNWFIHFIQI